MNKKFFTLIASVLMLVGFVGSGYAQGITLGTPIGNLPKTDGGQYIYQIGITVGGPKGTLPTTTSDYLLSVSPNGVLHLDGFGTYARPYGQSLWCADFAEWDFSGGYAAGLTFTNRASQKYLMASVEDSYTEATDSINVNLGEQYVWGLSAVYGQNIEQGMPIYSYFTEDSVIVLLYDNAAVPAPATVEASGLYVARIAANDFFYGVQTGTWGNDFYYEGNQGTGVSGSGDDKSGDLLYATILKPNPILLTANDFNTLLQTKTDGTANPLFQKLKFTKDSVNVTWYNPWSAFELRAEDVNANRITALNTLYGTAIPTADPWLAFRSRNDMNTALGGTQNYLRVDTVYAAPMTQNLTFNFGATPALDFNSAAASSTVNYDNTAPSSNYQLLEAQYYFRLTYNVYNDSLGIDVMQARYVSSDPTVNKNQKWFNEYRNSGNTAGASNINGVLIRTWEGYSDGAGSADPTVTVSDPALDPTLPGIGSNGWVDADHLHVGLKDLGDNKTRLITLLPPSVFTYAQLGLGGCVNENLFESIDEGLYVIVNTAGLALGVPINTDTLAWQRSTYPPVLTNLYGIQDPQQMPSYQWVVKKIRQSRPDYSPIRIINREFPNIYYSPVQLLKGQNTVIDDAHAPNIAIAKSFFTKVDKKYSTDEHLGYFYIDDRTARLSSYDLNYLHSFDAERYLGVGSAPGKANGLAIQPNPFQWTFVPVQYRNASGTPITDAVAYGYTPSTDDTKKLDIAQLKRTAYTIRNGSATAGQVLFIDNQKTYVSTPLTGASSLVPSATAGLQDFGVFLIKTNNTKDGKNYYALLDTNSFYGRYPDWNLSTPLATYNHVGEADYVSSSNGITPFNLSYTKVGVADGSVVAYAQPQKEVRTSAFYIGVYHAPLYRRFDGGEYTYGNGPAKVTEPYAGDNATDKDSPLFLKFHDIVQDWMFLYENADKGNKFRTDLADQTISFLGLQDAIHFPEGAAAYNKPYYEFFVDTAYVKRTVEGKGGPTVNPDEYTPMPQYMLALRPTILPTRWVWWEDKTNTWYDQDSKWNWDNVHPGETVWRDSMEVPALTRGFYLFNATDSVARGKRDFVGKLADNIENDIRFAFVDGIHLGDTFYVLPKTTVSAEYIQLHYKELLWTLPWYKKHYLGENTHYVPRWTNNSVYPNTVSYTGGVETYPNGKSMVFQFRLRNVGQTGGNPNRDFYVESQWIFGNEIGPDSALFINNHNGAPILSKSVPFPSGVVNNEGALGLNVVKADDYGKATANEAATVEGAKVISGTGSVTILNAAGKTVTVTNVLGQVVAKTVATSDNATIALPKGIVVVSVDGNSSKALVK
ncbi:hypothetical protein FACS1894181_16360 [Bacteroidia bacterium]|nr:hypothetical protein FACS1894181_16360 [Bacteroidia bacterium]